MNMNQCIYCETSNDLNTQFSITVEDGKKIQVKICDKHSEEATVKTAKEAYLTKIKRIEEVMAQAKLLGLHLSENANGFVHVAPSTKPIKQAPQIQDSTVLEDLRNDPNAISTSKLDGRGFQSVGGDAGGYSVSSHSSHDFNSLSDKLPEGLRVGLAQMSVVEGRGGQPLVIPQKRVDGTGTTTIIVKKSENDDRLQSRFKKMAQDSIGDKTPDFARAGYQNTTRSCPICRGSGVIIQARSQTSCPKCSGSGMISVY